MERRGVKKVARKRRGVEMMYCLKEGESHLAAFHLLFSYELPSEKENY